MSLILQTMGLIKSEIILKIKPTVLILMYLVLISTQCRSQEQNRCMSKETCSECIQEDPSCSWCSQEISTTREISRCNTNENLQREGCSNITHPRNSIRNVINNPSKGAQEGDVAQIVPQEMRIQLRPSSIQKFFVYYRQAVDYPVDLYLLMDLSYTMRDDKKNLARLGQTLGSEMQSITSNFRLGFGSFVDKAVAPYSHTHPSKIDDPCQNGCARSYSFKNHVRLTSNIGEFVRKVNDARISANIDPPEGTLDAIMQVITCQAEIGWRQKSRKLVVIATDEDFHYAGDGKLGGIIKPNDCKCHLDSNGYYTMGEQQDYPSLSQMKRKIKEENVYLIFAVPDNKMPHYDILRKRLTATAVGRLAKDSSNIVTLIKKQYDKISSSIEMTETVQGSSNIEISYHSKCLGNDMRKRNVCNGIKPGDTVTFEVYMKYSVCPENPKEWRNQKIEIHPVGLSDSLTVYLDMICACDCPQDRGKEEENRRKWCSGKGTYECGVCRCDDDAYGIACECDISGNQMQSNSSECKRENDKHDCSNRGECRCGKCFCDERENPEEKYSGKYCECSNFNCFQINQKICNGQGTCVCGTCKCNKGWGGSDCRCIELTDNCVHETGAEVCSGHGTCNCGDCACYENYYGKLCDDCEQCPGKCDKYGVCVKCVLSSMDKGISPEQCENCEESDVELVDKVEVNMTKREKVCSVQDENGCNIVFKYRMDDYNFVIIEAESTRKCPLPPDVLTIASSTAGGVLFVGILTLLLLKCITEVHDRREWAKFQKDLDKAQWDSGNNPIFIEPSSTFQNPAFGGN